jgi:hypothetical protein
MRRRYAFIVCFAISLLPFLAVNLWGYIAALNGCEGDCIVLAGFPFWLYTTGGFVEPPHIIWDGVVADVLFAIGVSAISAKLIQSVFQPAA